MIEPALPGVTDWEPLVALAPDQATEAVQVVAPVVDQVRVDEPPKVMVAGLGVMVRVGAAGLTVIVADEEADPPGPVQVRV